MLAYRRHLRRLNAARAVAVTTLLVASFGIELIVAPERPLRELYLLSAAAYGTIIVHALLDRFVGSGGFQAAAQLAGDTALVALFVTVTGGGLSPLSFLFALPVMLAASMWGSRGGVAAAAFCWLVFVSLLAFDLWRLPPGDVAPGRMLHAAVGHLVGFVVLGMLGGALADRLRQADTALAEQRGGLEALRALHADIVESISSGLLTTDAEGRITFLNRAGAEITRFTGDEIRGLAAAELFGLSRGFLAEADRALASGKRYRFERTWKRPFDGEELCLGFAVSVLRGTEREPEGWLVVFQDLTDLVFLEEQVRIRERMAALGEMAAGMAHELRNPLTAITGCVQVLGMRDPPPEQRNLIDITVRETERLNRIIRDFLQFARPGPFRQQPLDLAGLMEEMARILRKSPEFGPNHRIEIVAGHSAPWAMADPDRLRQVFWNLAGNALKAMPDGGTIAVRIEGHGGDRVLLTFSDEGEGMDVETLNRLFQPFHGRFRDGSGLGAAIVYRIVEEHGGRVAVQSRPGRGTEFRLILPAAPPEPSNSAVRAPALQEEASWR